ncbi:hypothetical protein ACLOJK_019715 [Asimina triloba]
MALASCEIGARPAKLEPLNNKKKEEERGRDPQPATAAAAAAAATFRFTAHPSHATDGRTRLAGPWCGEMNGQGGPSRKSMSLARRKALENGSNDSGRRNLVSARSSINSSLSLRLSLRLGVWDVTTTSSTLISSDMWKTGRVLELDGKYTAIEKGF